MLSGLNGPLQLNRFLMPALNLLDPEKRLNRKRFKEQPSSALRAYPTKRYEELIGLTQSLFFEFTAVKETMLLFIVSF